MIVDAELVVLEVRKASFKSSARNEAYMRPSEDVNGFKRFERRGDRKRPQVKGRSFENG
jgi:hypothetical protein